MTGLNKLSTRTGIEKVCTDASPSVTQASDLQKRVSESAQRRIREATLEHGGPLPAYGSAAWEGMPFNLQFASMLVAAECWRQDSDPAVIAERFGAELEHMRWTAKQAEDQQYQDQAAHHRLMWSDHTKRRAVIAVEVETEYRQWRNGGDAA